MGAVVCVFFPIYIFYKYLSWYQNCRGYKSTFRDEVLDVALGDVTCPGVDGGCSGCWVLEVHRLHIRVVEQLQFALVRLVGQRTLVDEHVGAHVDVILPPWSLEQYGLMLKQ